MSYETTLPGPKPTPSFATGAAYFRYKPIHPLKIYAYYRLLISFLFFLTIFIKYKPENLGSTNPALFVITSLVYLLLASGTLVFVQLRSHLTQFACFIVVSTDIVLLSVFAHASGGISSDISILLLVTVAAGSIMTNGRIAMTIAAIATLAVLFDHVYFAFADAPTKTAQSIQAGILGIAFFATSLLIQSIARRLTDSEHLRLEATAALGELEELNRHIIQRMRTGIIVITPDCAIKMMNESAQNLLATPGAVKNQRLQSLSPSLSEITQKWQEDNITPAQKVFQGTPEGPELIVSMTQLEPQEHDSSNNYILIFLEDHSRMTQHAQQLKLASLGQLTAAIAHEVRNPLGAISHAAQLLMEADHPDAADARLADIIQQHSIRVNQIIENVLGLSRRKASQPQRFNVSEWLEKLINELPDKDCIEISGIENKTHAYHKHTDQIIEASFDLSQLQQVIHNLIENGLRYSRQNGSERLLINLGIEPKNDRPYLEVIDFGEGISEAQQERLFEPFFTTENSGTGLGLYISRELCQSNQARLDYIAKTDKVETDSQGACFRITFAHPDKLLKQ